ncbi:Uncharacterized protein conserved in bacteria [Serratia rubidaea]|uniref:Uncharacterized protein conserved in bacteria n=1 Tax=Serratia rubidaea TaxID=61652 RepID=A0A4U9HK17_SERRU|nr:Uncharacterized protein conserved in bacteria [Serratia rubidaea]
MHVYSRLPLGDAEIQYLVDKEIPSMHMLVQLADGPQVRLHCVHPMPPARRRMMNRKIAMRSWCW